MVRLTLGSRAVCPFAASVTLAVWLAGTSTALASGWTIQPTPNPTGVSASALKAVSCPAATSCIGVGDTNDISGPIGPLAEQWNGTAWSIHSTPRANP
jgi:hypothetical protein